MGIASDIIKNLAISTLPKISVTSGTCRYNFRCQLNTVHDALNDGDEKIAMCICIKGGEPFIHFVNIHNEIYIDNTLGRWSGVCEYYLVNLVTKDEFLYIDDVFTAYRKELKRIMPWYIRWFNKCEF